MLLLWSLREDEDPENREVERIVAGSDDEVAADDVSMASPRVSTTSVRTGRNETSSSESGSDTPEDVEQGSPGWADYNPLAARNARYRAESMDSLIESYYDAKTDVERHGIVRAIAKIAAYTQEDFFQSSDYSSGTAPLIAEPGYHVSANGGALYRIPVGRYPLLDTIEALLRGEEIDREGVEEHHVLHSYRSADALLRHYKR
jgi:hypothetical protein